jgi:hypothetical protein
VAIDQIVQLRRRAQESWTRDHSTASLMWEY